MVSKQHNFPEKRCCVAELTLQNLFFLSYISTTNISITINAFSDTLSGSSSSDKNVLVSSEKTAPRNHQGMNIVQHSTFFPGNRVVVRAFSHHSQPLCNRFSRCCLSGRTYLRATNTENQELTSPAKIWKIFLDISGTASGNVL